MSQAAALAEWNEYMPEPLIGAGESIRARAVRRRKRQARSAMVVLCMLAVAVFMGGITWGLPSKDADSFLFSTRPAWSGQEMHQLAGPRTVDAHTGADVDRDPVHRKVSENGSVELNSTPGEQASIALRYRLFTNQPDEMVTLMSLAQMSAGRRDFDPKMYQYGGLWIYPVGGLLRTAGLLRWITLTSDLPYYLDRPEAFGRFYIVARSYVVAWGLLGAWAMFALVRRWTRGSLQAAGVACFCYIMLPVVVNMSHEAKPHLPGAVLMLMTILAAAKYVRTTELRWWLAAAVLAGLSVGMVLAAWPVAAVLPIAVLLVRQGWRLRLRMLAIGGGLVAALYFLTNPYVFLHLFDNRGLLMSNLSNTSRMFTLALSREALSNALILIGEGTTNVIAVFGGVAILVLMVGAVMRRPWAARHPGWLLVGPAILVSMQFVLFAEGQPGAYGRFAIFLDLSLLIAAVVCGYGILHRLRYKPIFLIVFAVFAALGGSRYYAGFVTEASAPTSRFVAAQLIEGYRLKGARTIGVMAEPAPYSVPPLDLASWRIILLPKDYDPASDLDRPDVIVQAVDTVDGPPANWAARYAYTYINPVAEVRRMQWAAKPFLILHAKTRVSPG